MSRLKMRQVPALPPKKRGVKPGTVLARTFMKVCKAPGCPREGEPFAGTARSIFCSGRCNLAAWRQRKREEAAVAAEETPDA